MIHVYVVNKKRKYKKRRRKNLYNYGIEYIQQKHMPNNKRCFEASVLEEMAVKGGYGDYYRDIEVKTDATTEVRYMLSPVTSGLLGAGFYLIPDLSVISGIIAIIAIISAIFSFFWHQGKIIGEYRSRIEHMEEKLLKSEYRSGIEETKKEFLEKEYRLELEKKLGRLDADSHLMMDRFNNIEIEFKRIAEFIDMQPRKNPYVAGGAVDDTRFWIGNKKLINRVLASISGNHFFIRGERRSGKTTLLRRISMALEKETDPEARFIPIYVSLQGIPPEMFFKRLCDAIVSKVNVKNLWSSKTSLMQRISSTRYGILLNPSTSLLRLRA